MNFRKILPMIAAVSLLTGAGLSQAQEPATEAASEEQKGKNFQVEEVFVTARKRTENLQDVPLSIKALSGEDLANIGAKTFTEYADEVPSLNFASLGEGQSRISIRGLQAPQGVAVVAFLLDGVPQQASSSSPDTELFDIESVQILRGPQGTLYGAGAVGGAIIVNTNPPRTDEFNWSTRWSTSQNDEGAMAWDGNVMINVPIIEDVLAARFVGFQRQADGYIDIREPDETNPAPLRSYNSENLVKKDANDKDVNGFRAAVAWYPTEKLSFILRGSKQDSDLGMSAQVSKSLQDRWGENTFSSGAGIGISSADLNYDTALLYGGWETKWGIFESISGVVSNTVSQFSTVSISLPTEQMLTQQDPVFGGSIALPAALQDIVLANGIFSIIEVPITNDYDYKNQEIRLVSTEEGPWQYTVGAFYQEQDRDVIAIVKDDGNLAGIADDTIMLQVLGEQWAIFGEVSWQFTERWGIVLGLRHFEEEIRQFARLSSGGDDQNAGDDFRKLTPKIGLNFEATEDILLYSVYAEGFRSGGFNVVESPPAPDGYEEAYFSDLLKSFEIGINSQFFDKRLTINAAVFSASWDKVQMDLLLENSMGNTSRFTNNLADAHSNGFEWEVTAILSPEWTLNFGGAYLEAELDEDAPNPNSTSGVILEGTSLENVPRWGLNSGITHSYFLDNGWNIASGLSANYRTETFGDITNVAGSQAEGSFVVNARIGLYGTGSKWNVTLFGNNLTNEDTIHFNFDDLDVQFRGPPRTFGLRFTYTSG